MDEPQALTDLRKVRLTYRQTVAEQQRLREEAESRLQQEEQAAVAEHRDAMQAATERRDTASSEAEDRYNAATSQASVLRQNNNDYVVNAHKEADRLLSRVHTATMIAKLNEEIVIPTEGMIQPQPFPNYQGDNPVVLFTASHNWARAAGDEAERMIDELAAPRARQRRRKQLLIGAAIIILTALLAVAIAMFTSAQQARQRAAADAAVQATFVAEAPTMTAVASTIEVERQNTVLAGNVAAATAFASGVRFSIAANDPYWQDTGVSVEQGQLPAIMVVEGEWTHYVRGFDRNPGTGDSTDIGDPNLPYPAAGQGALIGRIGNDELLLVGSGNETRAASGGNLYLWINDGYMGDNEGELTVLINVQ